MPVSGPLDQLPLWAVFGTAVAVVLTSVEAGYQIGGFRRQFAEGEKEQPVGAIVAAALGLLAFILAFTFGLTASRFDARRQIVVEEANAIGTTFLRAGLLPDERRNEVRRLLREYTDLRLQGVLKGEIDQLLSRSDELHRAIWAQAEAAGREQPNSIMVGLFVESLNETIDIHATRVQLGLRNRMPGILWATLGLCTILPMAGVGYHEGLSKSRRSLAVALLAMTFASVIALIADLDRPQEGMLRVGQHALLDLQQTMTEFAK